MVAVAASVLLLLLQLETRYLKILSGYKRRGNIEENTIVVLGNA